jgi:hypothetical protein
MTHQGWDVQLTAYAARDWRANFFPVGIAPLRRRLLGVGANAVADGAAGGVGGAQGVTAEDRLDGVRRKTRPQSSSRAT